MSITTTPQMAKVYAIFDNPPVVFTCRVNQTFSTHDKVFEFTYDGATGTYTNILPGMTILLGSTPGACDKGIIYCRKAPTSTKIFTGETSEVAWADNLYVTVLQDWSIWNEYLRIATNGTVYMKYDVAYSNQHSKMKPVPILGPDRVVRFAGSSVDVSFDGSHSYVPGSTIASHAFSCAGATITGAATATPTIHITAAGRYVVAYTVTSAQGVSSTTYRIIWAWDNSTLVPSDVVLASMAGDFDTGGWSFDVSILNDASTIRERTKVVMFSEEWYGDTQISYGPIAGAENIISIGWISDEKITLNPDKGDISVNVQGTQYWLQKIYSFVPQGIERTGGTPTSWVQMNPVTVDKVLWNLFMWRSTVTNCVDVFLTGDTRQATELTATSNSVWEQVKEIANTSIMAMPCCDRYGRVIVQIEPALTANANRASISTTATITHDDCETIDVERISVTPASQVVLSGVSVSGGTGAAKFSLSRGHVPSHFGTPIKIERLLLSTQALANELAGNILEKANIPYRFTFNNLLYNNRLVDICPNQFITATISAADNPRGISYSGNAIVKHIDLSFNDGDWDITWETEPETKSVLAVNGDIPTNPGDAPWVPPQFPPLIPPKPPEIVIPPSPVVITPLGIVAVLLNGYGIWAMDTINAPGVWFNVTTPFDWTTADIALIQDFVLSPIGTAYIIGQNGLNPPTSINLWSQTVGTVTPRTTIADVTYFASCPVTAIGFKSGTADQLAVISSTTGSVLGGNSLFTHKLAANGLSLTPAATLGNGYNNGNSIVGNITSYLDKWYSAMYEWGGDHAFKLNDGLTAIEGSRLNFGTPGVGIFHCQASQADIMFVNARNFYSVQPSTLTIINDITDGHSTSFPFYSIACDPTGVFVFSCADIVRKSSDSGVTWTTITNFPSLSYDGSFATLKRPAVYNMGDANKWLVAYNMTVHMEPGGVDDRIDRLHIWYTADFGATWQDWAAGLVVNGIVAENSIVGAIQNA